MRKITMKRRIILILCLILQSSALSAEFSDGTGEPNDPYLISTADELNSIGQNPGLMNAHFKLINDIDLTDIDFFIIGNEPLLPFTGVFDGNNHTISNFTYTSNEGIDIGLFGAVWHSEIKDLGLINPNIESAIEIYQGPYLSFGSLVGAFFDSKLTNCYVEGGRVSSSSYQYVGGLVGWNGGSITNCYTTASVAGYISVGGLAGLNEYPGVISKSYSAGSILGHNRIGGLVGENAPPWNEERGGTITNCYSTSSVSGTFSVGGLVGRNESSSIINCYSAGSISGENSIGGLVGYMIWSNWNDEPCIVTNCYSIGRVSGDKNIGGLVGNSQYNEVTASFWDIQTSGQLNSAGGTRKTTAQMQTLDTFLDSGWDFVDETENGTEDIWTEPDGSGYPILLWQLSLLPESLTFSGGTGEPNDPYLISTTNELISIGQKPNLMTAHFELINDIDLAGVNIPLIGSKWYPFRGTFDGNSHTISNFAYTSTDSDYIGLFRYVTDAGIRDLGLITPNINVDEGDFHGGLIGNMESGSITNCYIDAGTISGNDYTGGLVGSSNGIIANCYVNGSVAGYSDYIGGLVGKNSFTIENCYTIGIVNGTGDDIGGLVGRNSGIITASYSNSSVKGRNAVGGFVGRCTPGEIVNCYAQGDVDGQWYVGGLVGSNGTGGLRPTTGTIRNCYSTASVMGSAQKGGFLGCDWGGRIHSCFWDIETSGHTKSYGGEDTTTTEMQMATMFLEAGWDFVDETENGNEDIWWILEGQDYPRLWWELIEDEAVVIPEG